MLNLLTQYRRDLHQIPELDDSLDKTYAYVHEVLSQYPCTLFSPSKSALCAFFDAGKDQAVAFRADMDALPVTEQNDIPFKSRHPGKMHACGHDGHMAMVLGLAKYAAENLKSLPHNVLLVFQPAEETTGGAKQICASGVFSRYKVKHIFGVHLWPDLAKGVVATRSREMLSKSSEITVTITGKSSHIAKYAEGRDALFAGVLFVEQAYAMVENELSPEEYRLLKFGKMLSGTVRNAVSANTVIEGSLRSFAPTVFDFMRHRLHEIAGQIEAQTGCTFHLHINEGYPAVINDAALYQRVARYLGEEAFEVLPSPYMIAEDFSFYQQEIPGLFFLLGTGGGAPLHADRFQFDEAVLLEGLKLYQKLLYLP